MGSYVDEQVEAIEVDVFRIGLGLVVVHTTRLGESTDHGRRCCVSAAKGGRESCDDMGWNWRNAVWHHDRPTRSNRKSGGDQCGKVHGFLEGAAAMCSGGESKQVCDRSRSKDRNPESPHVLVGGRISRDSWMCELRCHEFPGRCGGSHLLLRHARVRRTSFQGGRTNLTETRPGRVRSAGVVHAPLISNTHK